MQQVKQVIDTNDPRVQYIISKDKVLGEYIKQKGKIEYFLSNNFNQFFVYSIIGQLISTNVANKIYARFSKLCNNNFDANNVLKVSAQQMRECGMTYKKADYILSFMQLLKERPNYFEEVKKMNSKDAIKELTKLHGVGKWTAKMILIFCFDHQDFVPIEDLAFLKGYYAMYKIDKTQKTPAQIEKDFHIFSPYMSIASRYIYEYGDELFGNIPKL